MVKPKEALPGLRAYMQRCRVTQMDLSRSTGISQSVISDILNGKHSPRLRTLSRLSKGTGLSINELVASKAA